MYWPSLHTHRHHPPARPHPAHTHTPAYCHRQLIISVGITSSIVGIGVAALLLQDPVGDITQKGPHVTKGTGRTKPSCNVIYMPMNHLIEHGDPNIPFVVAPRR